MDFTNEFCSWWDHLETWRGGRKLYLSITKLLIRHKSFLNTAILIICIMTKHSNPITPHKSKLFIENASWFLNNFSTQRNIGIEFLLILFSSYNLLPTIISRGLLLFAPLSYPTLSWQFNHFYPGFRYIQILTTLFFIWIFSHVIKCCTWEQSHQPCCD